MTALVALLLQASDADALLAALRKRIADAPAIRVDFASASGERSVRGELKLKGDKWALSLTSSRGAAAAAPGILLYDGRRTYAGGAAAAHRFVDPDKTGAALRAKLDTASVFIALETVLFSPSRMPPPTPGDVKEAARETIDGRECRVLQYVLALPLRRSAVKLHLDARTLLPVRREDAFVGGLTATETYAAFALDDLPDDDFRYASRARLAAARAAQAAASVDLFTRFTGRHPDSLTELAARPADLPPEAFWPEGGYPIPADPAGKPYALDTKDGRLLVGGVAVAAATGRAVGAPSERLRRHFEARVRLQILAAAARARFLTYGEHELDLASRPADLPWPEGGWLPAGAAPSDPWGRPFAIDRTDDFLRLRVVDADERRVEPDPPELAALEAVAAVPLSAARRERAIRDCEALGSEDLSARQDAEARLRAAGEAMVPVLEERLMAEKDVEVSSRLRELLRTIPRTAPPWRRELGRLTAYVGQPWDLSQNERLVSASLKTLASAQADFRANDRDANKVNDFWTGDVAGLYALTTGGQAIKLIELPVAAADAAPLPKGSANGRHAGIGTFAAPAPRRGYYFQAMSSDAATRAPFALADGGLGRVHHPNRFGFCAFPAEYGSAESRTFILGETNVVWWKDTQGEAVLEWPAEEDLLRDWKKLD